MTSLGKAITDLVCPASDRAAFIEQNAIALMSQRDATIQRMHQELAKMNKRVVALKKERGRTADENKILRARIEELERR